MIILGLTGGIGSGKSTVAEIFSVMGIPVFYADVVAKQQYLKKEVVRQVEALLETKIKNEQGIDFGKIAGIVFQDRTKLSALNHIIHPLVQREFEKFLEKHCKNPFVVKEAAILIESGAYKRVDHVILVSAPIRLRIQRVMQRDRLTEQQIRMRMRYQWPERKLRQYADFVIRNDEKHLLLEQIHKILHTLQQNQ